jgi:Flp pilus assembly protein TadG
VRRGQSLTEFALVLPVLLLLFAGSLDLGRAYYYGIAATGAARDGARVAVSQPAGQGKGPGWQAVCDAVRADLSGDISSVSCGLGGGTPLVNQAVVVVTCPDATRDCTNSGGSPVNANATVEVRYGFGLVTPLLGWLVPSGVIQMHSDVQMVTSW